MTVGKVSSQLKQTEHLNTHSAHEQMLEMLTDYEKNIYQAIESGKKQFPDDFYVVVLMKRERLMSNVIRNYYFTRQSCPTPQHEQAVYRFKAKEHDLEFLWVVPSLEACVTMYNEAKFAHPDERQLLQFVLDFRDGTLLRKALELNGESSGA